MIHTCTVKAEMSWVSRNLSSWHFSRISPTCSPLPQHAPVLCPAPEMQHMLENSTRATLSLSMLRAWTHMMDHGSCHRLSPLYISSMYLDIRHVAEIVVEWVKTLVLGIPRDRMAVVSLSQLTLIILKFRHCIDTQEPAVSERPTGWGWCVRLSFSS